MQPHPLVGIFSDNFFEDLGKFLGVLENIAVHVSGARQLYRGLESKAVLFDVRVPIHIAGDYRGASVQGHAGESCGGAGWRAEKIYKNSFFGHGVLIGKDSHRAGILQNF